MKKTNVIPCCDGAMPLATDARNIGKGSNSKASSKIAETVNTSH
jgi:hypothetical protein